MMTREDFYLEQLVPLYKRISDLEDERRRRYARLETEYEKQLEQLDAQRQELREKYARENQLLQQMRDAADGEATTDTADRNREVTQRQHCCRLEMLQAMDVINASMRKVSAQYRMDKKNLAGTMSAQVSQLYQLIGLRRRDFEQQLSLQKHQGRQEWGAVKRWIYRTFFAPEVRKKGGEV